MEYCKIHENDTPDEIEKPIQSNIMFFTYIYLKLGKI